MATRHLLIRKIIDLHSHIGYNQWMMKIGTFLLVDFFCLFYFGLDIYTKKEAILEFFEHTLLVLIFYCKNYSYSKNEHKNTKTT